MRSKEEAHDYRYFPDPDLLPLVVDDQWIQNIEKSLPELPDDKRNRYMSEYGLSETDAEVLTSAKELADYFEAGLQTCPQPKPIANWIMGSLLRLLNAEGKTVDESPIPPGYLAELVKLIDSGAISGKIAKTVFDEMAKTGKAPDIIVKEKGLVQVTDTSVIETSIDKVLQSCPDEVAAYKGGKEKLFGFFVGQVMKETKGKANPKIVNDILRKKLDG